MLIKAFACMVALGGGKQNRNFLGAMLRNYLSKCSTTQMPSLLKFQSMHERCHLLFKALSQTTLSSSSPFQKCDPCHVYFQGDHIS